MTDLRNITTTGAAVIPLGAIYINHFNDYDKGIADFRKVLSFPNKADPTQLDARLNLGFVYNKKGEFDNAIAVCDEAILINQGLKCHKP